MVRAVASGLAASGSVDGYVYEVLGEVSPGLVAATEVVRASDWSPFPPIACPRTYEGSRKTGALRAALLRMPGDADGQRILELLRLDGFTLERAEFFDPIRKAMDQVRGLG